MSALLVYAKNVYLSLVKTFDLKIITMFICRILK